MRRGPRISQSPRTNPRGGRRARDAAAYNGAVLPLLPAVLLAFFAAWCGSLGGASTAAGGLAAEVALVAVAAGFLALLGGRRLPPLPLAAWASLATPPAVLIVQGCAAPGAAWGRGTALVQALALGLALPRLVAACWSEPRPGHGPQGVRHGVAAVAVVLLGISAWALGDWLLAGALRPALPLGHHNLLAAWLVIVLPLAAVGLRERGVARGLAAAACAAGLAALLASRSLAGAMALALEAALACLWLPAYRRWITAAALAGLALPGLLLYGPRLANLATGADPSLAARATYWRAGWQGFLERPLLGWGSGSVPWTLPEHLVPRPGINPPSEVVGTLHSLPLELAYELGAVGLLAIVAAFFVFSRDRLRRRAQAADPALLTAALVSLAGAAACGLTESWLAVTAVPVALTVACGAALAATGERAGPAQTDARQTGATQPDATQPEPGTPSPPCSRPLRGLLLASLAAAGLLAFALVPALRRFQAKRHYQEARLAASVEEGCAGLRQAARLDPAQPLYRARLAWCGEGDPGMAYAAAVEARGLGILWASAGALALSQPAGLGHEAEGMLRRALALDPLAAPAPYLLAVADPSRPDAALCGARALLAEPRLAAAPLFAQHPDPAPMALAHEVRRAILAWPGIDPGWREAMAELLARPVADEGGAAALGLGFDDLQGGASLYAFRLPPWRAEWFSVPVDATRLAAITIPPAAVLPSSQASAFPQESCAPVALDETREP